LQNAVGRDEHILKNFFFQAEDGIRDFHVTGVQTCALPILALRKLFSLSLAGSPRPTIRARAEAALPQSYSQVVEASFPSRSPCWISLFRSPLVLASSAFAASVSEPFS